MREILFRGKRVDNGEWVYGYYARFRNFRNEVYDGIWRVCDDETKESEFQIFAVLPETVGQFTGLCDKNGTKIFEGDIVKVTIGVKGYRTTYDSVNCTVEFRSDNCGIAVFYPFTNSNIIETEVIGNIYDNKGEEE